MWYDTKKRLQKRLGYKDKEFAKIKFYFVPEAYYNTKIVPLEEGPPSSHLLLEQCILMTI